LHSRLHLAPIPFRLCSKIRPFCLFLVLVQSRRMACWLSELSCLLTVPGLFNFAHALEPISHCCSYTGGHNRAPGEAVRWLGLVFALRRDEARSPLEPHLRM
jgi:hypothetical protein